MGFIGIFKEKGLKASLEKIAEKLSTGIQNEMKLKTRVRRLYDIANVFKSIGLI